MKNLKNLVIPGILLLGSSALIYSCLPVKVPSYATLLDNFDLKKYEGKWYEIARFDFKFEKDLKNVTAEYTLLDDGVIRVINRGFHMKKLEWKEAIGKAKPNRKASQSGQSALKVSFFSPFYSGYNVVMMDPDYENALVFGESRDYMWILSRHKTIPENVKQNFLNKAKSAGFNIDQLIWTIQD